MKTLPPCDHDSCPPTHCQTTATPAGVASSEMFGHLERLIKEKGQLDVRYTNGGGMGLFWSASIGGNWPYCGGGTLEGALKILVSEHLRIEREELQKRINAIDESAGL